MRPEGGQWWGRPLGHSPSPDCWASQCSLSSDGSPFPWWPTPLPLLERQLSVPARPASPVMVHHEGASPWAASLHHHQPTRMTHLRFIPGFISESLESPSTLHILGTTPRDADLARSGQGPGACPSASRLRTLKHVSCLYTCCSLQGHPSAFLVAEAGVQEQRAERS